MSSKLLIIGSGGHAKVSIDLLMENHVQPDAILAKDSLQSSLWEIPIFGEDKFSFSQLRSMGFGYCFVAIGDNRTRVSVYAKAIQNGMQPRSIVSGSARISKHASLGLGTLVMHNVVINADTTIGNFSIINTSAVVEHDCIIGDGVHIAPNSTVCGGVCIGAETFIGAGSTVRPNSKIGDKVVVGAGSTVVADVQIGVTVVGSPAREVMRS
jgi:sugar O-acyltransferase (sialic acid O-acetyltransferase NeuD family)